MKKYCISIGSSKNAIGHGISIDIPEDYDGLWI